MLKRSNHPVLITLLFVALMNFAQLTIAQHDADHFGHAHVDACEFCHLAENHEAPPSTSTIIPTVNSNISLSSTIQVVKPSTTATLAYQSRAPPFIR